ncbi:MAG: hypothetical protein ACC656_08790, partial [Candidatus Heimdallarchaeota archaeon]
DFSPVNKCQSVRMLVKSKLLQSKVFLLTTMSDVVMFALFFVQLALSLLQRYCLIKLRKAIQKRESLN